MLVSIIVPVYNTQDYLDKCIQSLQQQSYDEIEIILVNDGSTDKSLELCKKYQLTDSRIVVIDKVNGGASSARNEGIQAANGKYIMFVDSDDFVNKDYVKTMLNTQHNNENTFVVCDLCGISKDGGLLPFHEDINEEGSIDISEYYKLSKWLLLNQPYNKIFLKDKIKKNNLLFKEELPIGEDIYFNLEYLRHCEKVFYVNQPLYFCLRNRDDSLCHKQYDNLLDIYKLVFSKHMELFSKFEVDKNYKDLLIESHYGEHVDCLDREIIHAKSKKQMLLNMKKIFRSSSYQFCLEHCKDKIPRCYYYVLSSKTPVLYYFYYKLSKLRNRK